MCSINRLVIGSPRMELSRRVSPKRAQIPPAHPKGERGRGEGGRETVPKITGTGHRNARQHHVLPK